MDHQHLTQTELNYMQAKAFLVRNSHGRAFIQHGIRGEIFKYIQLVIQLAFRTSHRSHIETGDLLPIIRRR